MTKRFAIIFALLAAAPTAWSGTWGQENWGQMYWGTNAVTLPTQAPTVQSIVADGEDLVVTIADYASGADGWSSIQSYSVTCGDVDTVVSEAPSVRISGLAADTQYECAVTASNVLGASDATLRVATTDALLRGLNIVIIRAALCSSSARPASC